MFKANVGDKQYTIELNNSKDGGLLDGKSFNWDIIKTGQDTYHIIINHKSYSIVVDRVNPETNEYIIRVNGKKIPVSVKDKMSLLMEAMGIDLSSSKKINEVKAPMPGLVLRAMVSAGDQVKKGDTLLVLEAMKMENSIKSPGDAEIAAIHVQNGQAVEKNQTLISFR